MRPTLLLAFTTVLALAAGQASAAPAKPILENGIPKDFQPVTASFDYEKRDLMIPMRDGVKLHTVMMLPKGAKGAPIILERTPYNASAAFSRTESAHVASVGKASDAMFFQHGYIRVYQDVRGKYGSEGEYVNERPLRGPLNPTAVDHSTDAYDTIDWLVKHTPESNGRVGMIGNSYDGMMVLMALVNPHPALKAAAPANPVVNTWMNDDDFHGGALRLIGFDYYMSQDTAKGSGDDLWRDRFDDYDTFLKAGSAGDFVKSRGLLTIPIVRDLHDHPTYDAYWKAQALETILAKQPQTVPTLFIASQWDQEDIYGAVHAFQAVKPHDANGVDHLVLGPWRHGGWSGDGATLGKVGFDSDTAKWFREEVLLPFFDEHLKPDSPKADIPPVLAFQTGANRWRRYDAWPRACSSACPAKSRPLYLQAGGGLSFTSPTTGGDAFDEYISDPKKPVPYRLRPIRPTYAKGSTWGQWLADDQRPFSDRTDVLAYETEPLTAPVTISGAPVANLVASTTGSDADWVVKLIDVYPDEDATQPEMGGFQLAVSMDILRGRYREGFDAAKPITPNTPLAYRFELPTVNHVFLPGHRIMVQVQSSWFPLYDRNPQSFVPVIWDAKPADYVKATQRVFHTPGEASAVELPVVSIENGRS